MKNITFRFEKIYGKNNQQQILNGEQLYQAQTIHTHHLYHK